MSPNDSPRTASFSPDGRKFLTAGGSGVRIWDSNTCKKLFHLRHSGHFCAAFSPNGEYLAVDGAEKSIEIYDTDTGTLSGRIKAGIVPSGISYSPNGRLLAAKAGKTILLWDMSNWPEQSNRQQSLLAGSPDG